MCNRLLDTLCHAGRGGTIASSVVRANVAAARTVLAALGCSGTSINRNSSRFAGSTTLSFAQHGGLLGAMIENYYIDTSRVGRLPEQERSFHFMHQLVCGAFPGEREALHVVGEGDYILLQSCPSSLQSREADAKAYTETRKAMEALNLSKQEQMAFCKLMAGILMLGNTSFRGANCTVANHQDFNDAAELLGFTPETLLEALTKEKVVQSRRTSTVTRSPEGAREVVVRLCEHLYGVGFDWMVARMNQCLMSFEPPWASVVVVDPCGFEDLPHGNSLAQCLINYQDERLKKFLNDHYYRLGNQDHDQGPNGEMVGEAQLIEYLTRTKKEDAVHIVKEELFPDNLRLASWEGPNGILEVIEKESNQKKTGNAKSVLNGLKKAPGATKYLKECEESFGLFSFNHSVYDIEYNEEHLLPDNHRRIPVSVMECIERECNDPIQAEIYPSRFPDGAYRRPRDPETLSSVKRLTKQMVAFLTDLQQTRVHRVICLRPRLTGLEDAEGEPDRFMLAHQLRGWNVISATRFDAAFIDNVDINIADPQWQSHHQDLDEEAKRTAMLSVFGGSFEGTPTESHHLSSQENILEWLERCKMAKAAVRIQCGYRRFITKLKYRRLGSMFDQFSRETRRFMVMDKFGPELRHDVLMRKNEERKRAAQATIEEANKPQQEVETEAMIQAKKHERARAIIKQKQMELAEREKKTRTDKSKGNQPTKAELELNLEQFKDIDLYKEEEDDGGFASDGENHPGCRRDDRGRIKDHYNPRNENHFAGSDLLQYHTFTGSKRERKALIASLEHEEELRFMGQGSLRRTPNLKSPVPHLNLVPPPSLADPGVNHPTAAVPADLVHCLEVYADDRPDVGSSWSPKRPPSPPKTRSPSVQQKMDRVRPGLKEEIDRLSAHLPPPPTTKPEGVVYQPQRARYGKGPKDNIERKFRNKYEYRESNEVLGYESGDSSVSEYSVGSTNSSEKYTPR